MLKYRCLVFDHDDTVVQTEKAIGYPYFRDFIEKIRPGHTLTFQEYVEDCRNMAFVDMCRQRWQFTEQELVDEYEGWKEYSRTHLPPIYPGIGEVIRRQKEEGGLVCVVSLSTTEFIVRDYADHFGVQPDAIYDNDYPEHQRKPNSFPLEDIMKRFDLNPQEILVVDDMLLSWTMAQPLGIETAFAAWSKLDFPEIMEEMERACDYTFRSAKDLETFLFDRV